MEWRTFQAISKEYIDPIAPRHTAIVLEDALRCRISGANSDIIIEDEAKHIKLPMSGSKMRFIVIQFDKTKLMPWNFHNTR